MQETTSLPFYSVYHYKMLNKEASTKLCGQSASLCNKLALWVRDLFCGCQLPDFLSNCFGILQQMIQICVCHMWFVSLKILPLWLNLKPVSVTKMLKLFSSVINPFWFSQQTSAQVSTIPSMQSVPLTVLCNKSSECHWGALSLLNRHNAWISNSIIPPESC